jgi:hypothetical protein
MKDPGLSWQTYDVLIAIGPANASVNGAQFFRMLREDTIDSCGTPCFGKNGSAGQGVNLLIVSTPMGP